MEKVLDLLCQRATPTSVSALLGGMTLFHVPQFQRAYEWKDEQVSAFIDDVGRCWRRRLNGEQEGHFFGSVVTSPKEPRGLVRPRRDVIDGQQRFATFLLFLAALRQHCIIVSKNLSDPVHASAMNTRAETLLSRFIMNKDLVFTETKDVYPLTLNQTDDSVFKRLLLDGDKDKKDAGTSTQSHRLLRAAYSSCFLMLQEHLDGIGSDERVFKALDYFYVSALEDWEVIHIEANAPEHAKLIFRVLNSRGLPVSDCDLLRATTMERAEQRLVPAEIDDLLTAWEQICGITEDPDIYLRLAYHARTGKPLSPSRTSTDFESMYFEELGSGDLLPAVDAKSLLKKVESLKSDMLAIKALSDGNVTGGGLKLTSVMQARLDFTLGVFKQHWILPLVYASRFIDKKEREQLLCVLDRFAFRYGVLARARIAAYNQRVESIIRLFHDSPGDYKLREVELILDDLLNKYASLEAMERQLQGLDYKKNSNELKYILAMSEFMLAWHEGGANGRPFVREPNVSMNIRTMTLEHIIPQNSEDAGADMQPLLHKLGNLTLLSDEENVKAGNKPFSAKKPIFGRSRLSINKKLIDSDDWGPEQATERQGDLLKQTKEIFKLTV